MTQTQTPAVVIDLQKTGQVKVGVAAFVWRSNRFLVMRRKNPLGYWGLPGGKLEFGEKPDDAIRREIWEETGIGGGVFKFIGQSSWINTNTQTQWITLFYDVRISVGNAEIKEPDKCAEMQWVVKERMPIPSFGPLAEFLHDRG